MAKSKLPKDFKFKYLVHEAKAVDGDTIKVSLDAGFGVTLKYSCRLFGVDCPERRTTAGKIIKSIVSTWIFSRVGPLICTSLHKGKYAGRFIGTLEELKTEPKKGYGHKCKQEQNLSKFLLDQKFARPYDGSRRPKWTEAELEETERRAIAFKMGDLYAWKICKKHNDPGCTLEGCLNPSAEPSDR
jgi:hypothetical protein